MNRPDEIAALADEYEAGTNKALASGYDEYGPDFKRKRQIVIDALRLYARLSATSPGDAVRMREAFRQIIVEMRDKHSSPTGDSYSCGVWDQSQRILSKLDEAALAPAEKAEKAEKAGDELPKRPFAFAVRCAPENGDNKWRLFMDEGEARAEAEQLDGDYEALFKVGDRRSAIPATPTPPRADVTLLRHLSGCARTFLQHFNPYDLAEDKAQQWQALEHQCDLADVAIQSAAHGGGTEGGERPCTCHPDDNPPQLCPQRYAYSECVKVSDPAQEPEVVAYLSFDLPIWQQREHRIRRLMTDLGMPNSLSLSEAMKQLIRDVEYIDKNTRPVSLDRLTESNISDEICHVFGCRSTCVSECNSEINKDKCGEAARRVLALIEGRT